MKKAKKRYEREFKFSGSGIFRKNPKTFLQRGVLAAWSDYVHTLERSAIEGFEIRKEIPLAGWESKHMVTTGLLTDLPGSLETGVNILLAGFSERKMEESVHAKLLEMAQRNFMEEAQSRKKPSSVISVSFEAFETDDMASISIPTFRWLKKRHGAPLLARLSSKRRSKRRRGKEMPWDAQAGAVSLKKLWEMGASSSLIKHTKTWPSNLAKTVEAMISAMRELGLESPGVVPNFFKIYKEVAYAEEISKIISEKKEGLREHWALMAEAAEVKDKTRRRI